MQLAVSRVKFPALFYSIPATYHTSQPVALLILFYQQMHFYLTYKILNIKIYIKTLFLQSLLHVSVRTDHHQGVYNEPSQRYFFFVDTVSKIT